MADACNIDWAALEAKARLGLPLEYIPCFGPMSRMQSLMDTAEVSPPSAVFLDGVYLGYSYIEGFLFVDGPLHATPLISRGFFWDVYRVQSVHIDVDLGA